WHQWQPHWIASAALRSLDGDVVWHDEPDELYGRSYTSVDFGANHRGVRSSLGPVRPTDRPTDSDLLLLLDLHRVLRLNLDGCYGVTDAGLVTIARLKALRELDLSQTRNTHRPRITDRGMASLRSLTQLQSPRLAGCDITDAGLAHLSGLAQLEELDLSDTAITDTGLVHLKGLARLKSLDLTNTGVTRAGVAGLV